MDRKRLKDWAKQAVGRNYWSSVLVSFILSTVLGAGVSSGSSSNSDSDLSSIGNFSEKEQMLFVIVMLIVMAFVFVVWLVVNVFKVFLLNPLEVGCQGYFCDGLGYNKAQLSALDKGFKPNYKNIIKTMFFRDLFLWLWSLIGLIPGMVGAFVCAYGLVSSQNTSDQIFYIVMLLVLIVLCCLLDIPRLIKKYEYRMIPYILADNPNMPRKQVFAMTKQMMEGSKWNTFVLDLSFLGWHLLNLCACGMLSIFYVRPYQNYTNAALYKMLLPKVEKVNGPQM